MGYGCVCVFVFFFCVYSIAWVGGSRCVGVKKGGVLAFIGVHGGLLFLFLFYPGTLRFISLYCYMDRCRRCLALLRLLSCWPSLVWPCLYLGGNLVRSYIFLFGDFTILFSRVEQVLYSTVHVKDGIFAYPT